MCTTNFTQVRVPGTLCLYVHVCMYVCLYVCLYVCMYVCMHACLCVCIHVHCMYADLYVYQPSCEYQLHVISHFNFRIMGL